MCEEISSPLAECFQVQFWVGMVKWCVLSSEVKILHSALSWITHIHLIALFGGKVLFSLGFSPLLKMKMLILQSSYNYLKTKWTNKLSTEKGVWFIQSIKKSVSCIFSVFKFTVANISMHAKNHLA